MSYKFGLCPNCGRIPVTLLSRDRPLLMPTSVSPLVTLESRTGAVYGCRYKVKLIKRWQWAGNGLVNKGLVADMRAAQALVSCPSGFRQDVWLSKSYIHRLKGGNRSERKELTLEVGCICGRLALLTVVCTRPNVFTGVL